MRSRGRARWFAALALSLWTAPLAYADTVDEEAIEDADEGIELVPLRRLDVVQNKSFTKEGRFELYPNAFGVITNNHFARRQVWMTGLGLAYHVREQVYFDLQTQIYPFFGPEQPSLNQLKGLTNALLQLNTGVQDPEPVVVSAERLYVGASIGFSPAYGKINLVGEHVQNLDFSILAGLGLLQVVDYSYIPGYNEFDQLVAVEDTTARAINSYGTGHLGIASRFPLTRWFTLKADARLVGYVKEVTDYFAGPSGVDDQGNTLYPSKKSFASSFMVSVGASFFFPTR